MAKIDLKNPIFCAIDTGDLARAMLLGDTLKGVVGGLKLGLEFFNAQGPQGLRQFTELGCPIFADLKLHDIPNTVAGAVRSILPTGIDLLNIHASGGFEMMKAARRAVDDHDGKRPLLLGVTLLTSLDAADLAAIGAAGTAEDFVIRLASLAQEAGLDGVVCSPHEIEPLRRACGPDFFLITPGIRPAGGELADQKRVMTPQEAVTLGASAVVIGRPITNADDPVRAAQEIAASITNGGP
jgi:orotidine-5'-phosphate decarboxylase